MGGTIGYQIRLESSVSTRTLATFCTYGVLLRSLCGGVEMLETLTHVIIDEIHERDAMSDFLLTVLRDALARYRHLKLILMSATVDTNLFLGYFPGSVHVSLDGRMFPVEEFHLENILLALNYKTKEMEKMKRSGLTNKSTTSIEELSSKLSKLPVPDSDDVVVEETEEHESLNIVDTEMDQILEDCFMIGQEEQFSRLCRRLAADGETIVNYAHSVSGVTALMASAMRGHLDTLDQCLQLGAEAGTKLTNGWTALDGARVQGQEEAARMLAEYEQLQGRGAGAGAGPGQDSMAPEEKERLELYHASVDQDRLDHDLILKLLGHIHRHQAPGAVLVFLPGYEDISTMCDLVSQDQVLGKETSIVILHSQIGSAESKKAFQQPPRGQRKIVLATNVAETGVTIPDIVYVVDTGKVKLKTFDSLTNTSMLKCEWISQTSATQRKGRAGRCQAGQGGPAAAGRTGTASSSQVQAGQRRGRARQAAVHIPGLHSLREHGARPLRLLERPRQPQVPATERAAEADRRAGPALAPAYLFPFSQSIQVFPIIFT